MWIYCQAQPMHEILDRQPSDGKSYILPEKYGSMVLRSLETRDHSTHLAAPIAATQIIPVHIIPDLVTTPRTGIQRDFAIQALAHLHCTITLQMTTLHWVHMRCSIIQLLHIIRQ